MVAHIAGRKYATEWLIEYFDDLKGIFGVLGIFLSAYSLLSFIPDDDFIRRGVAFFIGVLVCISLWVVMAYTQKNIRQNEKVSSKLLQIFQHLLLAIWAILLSIFTLLVLMDIDIIKLPIVFKIAWILFVVAMEFVFLLTQMSKTSEV